MSLWWIGKVDWDKLKVSMDLKLWDIHRSVAKVAAGRSSHAVRRTNSHPKLQCPQHKASRCSPLKFHSRSSHDRSRAYFCRTYSKLLSRYFSNRKCQRTSRDSTTSYQHLLI